MFVAADNGAVFFVETSNTSARVRVGWLRFLQSGEVKAIGSDRAKPANMHVLEGKGRRLSAQPAVHAIPDASDRKPVGAGSRGF